MGEFRDAMLTLSDELADIANSPHFIVTAKEESGYITISLVNNTGIGDWEERELLGFIPEKEGPSLYGVTISPRHRATVVLAVKQHTNEQNYRVKLAYLDQVRGEVVAFPR